MPWTAIGLLAAWGVIQAVVVWAHDRVKWRWFTPMHDIEPEELPPF